MLDMFKTNQRKEPMRITLEKTILIIKQHGNLDEIYDFFKSFGTKQSYNLKDVKNWLGY
tara:strand:+ start:148 stop:324 length:177 start_codon:yes stop_codon:yes gene_type:complete